MNINDNPICRADDDRIGRVALAEKFAQQVLDLDPSNGIVVGVLGPWGSGKTSFINLARATFNERDYSVLEFNPWMFSSSGHLVMSFFGELKSKLTGPGSTIAEIGSELLIYATAISCNFGPGGALVAKSVDEIVRRQKKQQQGVAALKPNIERLLSGLDKPLIVVLDDIDRLTTSEIRDVFKLVRLTASFPNVVYIVAFDRERVENALKEQGIQGRDYLEKILQFSVDLPVVPGLVLQREIRSAITIILEQVGVPIPINERVWATVLQEILAPLIRNMRDVNRYAIAIHTAVRSYEGRIQLADLFALEAIRMFLPGVFKDLHSAIDILTGSPDLEVGLVTSSPSDLHQQRIDGLIQAAGEHAAVVKNTIDLLFPAAKHFVNRESHVVEIERGWIRERRVANEDILRLYLERRETVHLRTFMQAEEAWQHMSDGRGLQNYLRSINPSRLHSVIELLELFKDEFRDDHVAPAIITLFNLFALPENRRCEFDESLDAIVTCIVIRLLRCLGDPHAVDNLLHGNLHNLESLSCEWKLIGIVGHRDGIGHRLVPEATVSVHEANWRGAVRTAANNATADAIDREHDLLGILLQTKRDDDQSINPLSIQSSPEMTLAVLRAAWNKARDRSDQATRSLDWEILIELYGDKMKLQERIRTLLEANLRVPEEIRSAANQYLEDNS